MTDIKIGWPRMNKYIYKWSSWFCPQPLSPKPAEQGQEGTGSARRAGRRGAVLSAAVTPLLCLGESICPGLTRRITSLAHISIQLRISYKRLSYVGLPCPKAVCDWGPSKGWLHVCGHRFGSTASGGQWEVGKGRRSFRSVGHRLQQLLSLQGLWAKDVGVFVHLSMLQQE